MKALNPESKIKYGISWDTDTVNTFGFLGYHLTVKHSFVYFPWQPILNSCLLLVKSSNGIYIDKDSN